jgi:hypothetical protein
MRLNGRFAGRAALCLVTTMAFVGAHELVHIAVGRALGLGAHFTSLTSADADPTRALAATPAALAWMAGAAPLFTVLAGIGALLAAPWARARRFKGVAAVLGWIAIFGAPYLGVQLMTLAGPAGLNGTGVDAAGVLVGYFRIGQMPRIALALGGVVSVLAAGYVLGGALGDKEPWVPGVQRVADISGARRGVGVTLVVLSIISIGVGAALLIRVGRANPMGLFLLADILWGVGLLIMTPWQRPGPQFVRDVWLAPAIAAMGVLTVIGMLFPSDYAAAGLFFLPQLATAAYVTRNQEFRVG